jgi:hypothetical protein
MTDSLPLDFLSDLLKEPDPSVRDFTRIERQIDKTVTSVINHFASVEFRCNYKEDGNSRCGIRTHFLFMGEPMCLDHCRYRLTEFTEADVAAMWERAKNI